MTDQLMLWPYVQPEERGAKGRMKLRTRSLSECWMSINFNRLGRAVAFLGVIGLLSVGCQGSPIAWERQTAGKPWSIQVVADNVRAGKQALRFEVREGDAYVSPRKTSYRSELSAREVFRATMGKEYWYGFSMYMPTDFPDHDNRLVIGQWHATEDIGDIKLSPVLSQRYKEGRFYVQICFSPEKVQRSDGTKKTLYSTHSFKKGVWHDFVYHVKWSYRDDGFVEMWWNGDQVIGYKGPVGYNDDEGPFFKYGIYRDDVPETYVMYFDEFRIGSSYDEVNPAANIPVD